MIGDPVPNAQGVYIVRADPTNGHTWRVKRVVWLQPGNADCNVTHYLQDVDGNYIQPLAKVKVIQGWPEIAAPDDQVPVRWDVADDGRSKADAFCPASWNPAKIDHGPYFFYVQDKSNAGAQSEYVGGFGTILRNHFHADVIWTWTPLPPAAPPPECPPGQYWNADLGQCMPNPVDHGCPAGQHWDDGSGGCVPDATQYDPAVKAQFLALSTQLTDLAYKLQETANSLP
jgi:hypothetical protein